MHKICGAGALGDGLALQVSQLVYLADYSTEVPLEAWKEGGRSERNQVGFIGKSFGSFKISFPLMMLQIRK